MVGNTHPYTIEDWLEDIKLAHRHDIDGFALNIGRESWQRDRVLDCYAAALQSQLHFKLFISFDMTSIPSEREEDIGLLLDYVRLVSQHPNQFLYDGKVMISTFAGENSMFGHADLNHGWMAVKKALEGIKPIHLIPSFFVEPARHPKLKCSDGYFNWNGGWPLHLTPNSPPEEIRCPRLDTDSHHIRHLSGKTFMAAISPWFFTHYGAASWNKNWIYRGDDWLLVRRWEQLVVARDNVDIVQIISWNDYGESHYIGPIKGAQPNSQAWVNGYPHDAWLELTSYFARAFKTGKYPPITTDTIYIWGRPHPKDAWAPDDVPRPRNWELTDDVFWVVVMATAPAIITLSSGSEDAKSFQLHAGLSKLCHPLVPGGTMRAELGRDGVLVTSCKPDSFEFQSCPVLYNFNALVAKSFRSIQH
ncbi:glycoside hydrolase family 71 protein [Neolentinus lepideus HHB14362 ss-1]|uniref:Glycoside hydrolase family 71 protein n=1 Tax=Neolentinus lepideus HHB14362 ss-1 TaxID=1314782 RepID=A0A165PJ43_9AGAM|nr:glycoside hydrolase family 71 protein [Neolentinus lepideus HHB14362 ss-1]